MKVNKIELNLELNKYNKMNNKWEINIEANIEKPNNAKMGVPTDDGILYYPATLSVEEGLNILKQHLLEIHLKCVTEILSNLSSLGKVHLHKGYKLKNKRPPFLFEKETLKEKKPSVVDTSLNVATSNTTVSRIGTKSNNRKRK